MLTCHTAGARSTTSGRTSSDPMDGIPLDGPRRLVTRWTRKGFPGFRVAIVYHDGNEGHVPHAHVIANDALLSLRLRSCRQSRAKRATGTFRPSRALAGEVPVAPMGRIRADPGSQAHVTAACLQDMDSYGRTVVPPVCPYESSCPLSARGRARRETGSLPPRRRGANPPVADWPREPAAACGATARGRHRPRPARRCGRAASSA